MHRRHGLRRRRLLTAVVTALVTVALTAAPSVSHAATAQQGVVLKTRVSPTAYYAAPMRNSAGRIDAAGTLSGVLARGAHGYQYLIANRWGYHSAQDWADLPAFLDLAHRWGIAVWVILLPPTESSTPRTGYWYGSCDGGAYPPYYGAYDTWFTAIGRLARTHPALQGSGMDDYPLSVSSYCKTFAAATPARWQSLQNSAAGRTLVLAPTMYLYNLTSNRMDLITSARLTSVIWPFDQVGQASLMSSQYASIKRRYPGLRITIMVFAMPASSRPTPTAATVDAEVKAAMALHPAGVVVYSQFVGLPCTWSRPRCARVR